MDSRHETILITHFDEIQSCQTSWKKFMTIGVAMMVLGLLGITAAPFLTMFSMVILGALLLAGGVTQVIHSFWARKWSGLFLSLLSGLLYSVAGLICMTKPSVSAAGLTLVIGSLFIISGGFRVINSVWIRFRRWGIACIHGAVTLGLGLLILSEWPASGIWIIGLFIGIDLFITGWFTSTLALSARKQW